MTDMQDDDEREAHEIWAILNRNPGLCVRDWLVAVRDKTRPTFRWSSLRQQQPIENQDGDQQTGDGPTPRHTSVPGYASVLAMPLDWNEQRRSLGFA